MRRLGALPGPAQPRCRRCGGNAPLRSAPARVPPAPHPRGSPGGGRRPPSLLPSPRPPGPAARGGLRARGGRGRAPLSLCALKTHTNSGQTGIPLHFPWRAGTWRGASASGTAGSPRGEGDETPRSTPVLIPSSAFIHVKLAGA